MNFFMRLGGNDFCNEYIIPTKFNQEIQIESVHNNNLINIFVFDH